MPSQQIAHPNDLRCQIAIWPRSHFVLRIVLFPLVCPDRPSPLARMKPICGNWPAAAWRQADGGSTSGAIASIAGITAYLVRRHTWAPGKIQEDYAWQGAIQVLFGRRFRVSQSIRKKG